MTTQRLIRGTVPLTFAFMRIRLAASASGLLDHFDHLRV